MTLEELSIIYTADVQPAMENVKKLVSVLYDSAAEASVLTEHFSNAGANAGAGLAQGILSAREQVFSAAREIASAAAETLRSALEIHSPSRVTQEMGVQFSSGLANGILSSAAGVSSAVSALAPSLSSSAHPVFENVAPAQENFHITIPLEVDGYQLGVAAIEGIHRVSRVTGRAELSI